MATSIDAPPGITRPVVFFDVSIGETPAGRIKMGKLLRISLTSTREEVGDHCRVDELQNSSATSHQSELQFLF